MSEFLVLADSWDGGEQSGVEHVATCQDYGCATCAVIACATDLRALATRVTSPGHENGAENDAPLWVVTELALSLPGPPPWGEPHPEETPVGPFESREAADAWAFAYAGEFGGPGSWSVAPLRVPPHVIPHGSPGGAALSERICRPTQPAKPCTACDYGYPASVCSSNCDCGAC